MTENEEPKNDAAQEPEPEYVEIAIPKRFFFWPIPSAIGEVFINPW